MKKYFRMILFKTDILLFNSNGFLHYIAFRVIKNVYTEYYLRFIVLYTVLYF